MTDRQTDRQISRQADRQTDIQTDRQIIYFKYSNLDTEIQILDRQIDRYFYLDRLKELVKQTENRQTFRQIDRLTDSQIKK